MFVHIAQLGITEQQGTAKPSVSGTAVAGNVDEAVLQNEVTLLCKDTPTYKLSKSGQRTRSKYGKPEANPLLSRCWMWQKRQSF
jgi:hypothetical protein